MRWSERQVAWISARYATTSNRALAEMATEEFGFPVTQRQMQSFGKNHHLVKAPGQRSRSLRESSFWTAERDEWMREYVPGHTEAECMAAFRERFGVEVSVGQLANRRHKLGLRHGTTGAKFRKGMTSHNKGLRWADYMSPEAQARCRKTQFHHEHLPPNTQPIGTERVTKDGYVEVKVAMRPSGGKSHDNWVPKARLVWERANGRAVPEDCMVVFLDGDKRNFDPANLALETRGEHGTMAKLGLAYADAPSHEVALTIARLKMATTKARKAL